MDTGTSVTTCSQGQDVDVQQSKGDPPTKRGHSGLPPLRIRNNVQIKSNLLSPVCVRNVRMNQEGRGWPLPLQCCIDLRLNTSILPINQAARRAGTPLTHSSGCLGCFPLAKPLRTLRESLPKHVNTTALYSLFRMLAFVCFGPIRRLPFLALFEPTGLPSSGARLIRLA